MKELDEAFELLHREARSAPADLSDARRRLMAELDRVPRQGTRRRWVIPVAAAAAVVVAAAVVTVRIDWSGHPGTPELPLAADVLNKAADITAVGAVDKPVGPGQYRYIVKNGWSILAVPQLVKADKDKVLLPYQWQHRIERWVPTDPNAPRQERRVSLGTPTYIGNRPVNDASLIQAKKLANTSSGTRQGTCATALTDPESWFRCDEADNPDFYPAKLSGDVDQLYAQLNALAKKDRKLTPSSLFATGIDVLGRGLMPAKLRAQWYRALARIPGVKVIDSKTTLDGRTGIALGLEDERERRELIIDPATGEFIGERTVAGRNPTNPLIEPGTEISQSAITTSVVNGIGLSS